MDVCVILPAFCGFMVSVELLKQLGAFQALCRHPKTYEEYIMISYYKELTKRCHLTSVIWLHDGIWIPRNVSHQVIFEAERAMLDQLQLNMNNSPLFSIRDLHSESQALLLNLSNNQARLALPDLFGCASGVESTPPESRPIRWNTQAPNTGYDTYLARMAKRRRVK